MLQKFFHRKWVTPLIIAVCVIPFITGVLMFYGFFKGSFIKTSHEWVGMAMVVFGLAHIFSHWASFKMYLKGKRLWLMSALFVLIIPSYFAFVAPLLKNEDDTAVNPRYLIQLVAKADIETFAALDKKDPELLKQKLEQQNIKIDDPQTTLETIAKEHNKSLFDLIAIMR